MAIKEDLNASQKNAAPTVVDFNFSTYQLQQQGNSQVYVEKYLVPKDSYVPFQYAKFGSTKRSRTNCILIKEDGFTDIGGGYATFLRHYARIPDTWVDYESKSVVYYFGGDGNVGINYDYGCGSIPYGFANCGFLSGGFSRRNLTVVAKATRYYIPKYILDSYFNNQYILPASGASWLYNPVYPDAQIENDYTTTNVSGLPKSIPSRLILNSPRKKTFKGNSAELVIATDRVKKWMGDIYEITRYTSQLLPEYAVEVSVLTIQFVYTFTDDVTEAQSDATTLKIDNTTIPPNFFETISEVDEPESNYSQSFNIQVEGGLYINGFTTSGGVSTASGNTFTTQWNGFNEVVVVRITLGTQAPIT